MQSLPGRIRIEALEQVIKKRSDVTGEEFRQALLEAASNHPLPDHPDSATALNTFLENLLKRLTVTEFLP